MQTVTVATFASIEEAYMAKNHLATKGVQAYLEGESAAGLSGPNSPAFPVGLQVAEDRAARAAGILRAIKEDPAEGE